jgi:hypothetical protein
MDKMNLKLKITFKIGIIIAGVVFYFYYGIYKMIYVHSDLVGGDLMRLHISCSNFINGQSIYFMPLKINPFFYPPLILLPFLYICYFNINTAIIFWFVLSHIIIFISAYILYKCGSKINKLDSFLAVAIALQSLFVFQCLFLEISLLEI